MSSRNQANNKSKNGVMTINIITTLNNSRKLSIACSFVSEPSGKHPLSLSGPLPVHGLAQGPSPDFLVRQMSGQLPSNDQKARLCRRALSDILILARRRSCSLHPPLQKPVSHPLCGKSSIKQVQDDEN